MHSRLWAATFLLFAAACGGTSATDPGGGGGGGGGGSAGGGGGGGGQHTDGGAGGSGGGGGGGGGQQHSDGGTTTNDASTGTPDGSTIQPSTGVTIIVEPNGNKGSELVAAINAATTSVYMTMYEIDDPNVVGALVARKKAGLDVKVILDGSTNTKTNNTAAYTSFTGASIDVIWSSSTFTYTHEKCVMIDHKQAWIMTMNLEKSSPADNREYLAIDNDAADVAEAEAIFNADLAGQSITPTGGLVVSPTNSRASLIALIQTATKSVDIEVEEFSDVDTKGFVPALVAVANKGIAVRVVIANMTLVTAQLTANSDAKAANIKVVMSGGADGSSTSSNPYISSKTILIDCATGTCTRGYVGSENLTTNSLLYNRELGVIFSDGAELAKVLAAVNTDFASGTPQ